MNGLITYVDGYAPLEACGLLAGKQSTVEKIFFIRNQANSPVRFVMNPVEQWNAMKWIDANSMDLLGIFHSHPTGPGTVSPTDLAESAYAAVSVILFPVNGQWKARGFWIENSAVQEVNLLIT